MLLGKREAGRSDTRARAAMLNTAASWPSKLDTRRPPVEAKADMTMISKHIVWSNMIRKQINNLDNGDRRYLYISVQGRMKRAGIIMGPDSAALLEIGQLLKKARQASAMTQEQVADLAGISRPRYRDIETGVASRDNFDECRPRARPRNDDDSPSNGSRGRGLAAPT